MQEVLHFLARFLISNLATMFSCKITLMLPGSCTFLVCLARILQVSARWFYLGSHEVAGKGYVFTKTSQMASIGVILTYTYHTKQLNPWPNSSASRAVNYSQLSACQGDMQPFEGDPYTLGRLTSHSKSSPGNFQHQYLAELLVNMYSYRLMVKSVSCCYVCGSRLFSDLVTYIYIYIYIYI